MNQGVTRIDLDGLIEFRRKLSECSYNVEEQRRMTNRAMDVVSQSWRDENFKEFESKFMEDAETIKKLIEGLDYFNDPILRRYQELLEEYLSINY